MRDLSRIDTVTAALNEMWKTYPLGDMRFGQLMSNFLGWCVSEKKCSDIWFPEEDKWIEWMQEYAERYKKDKWIEGYKK